MHFGAKQTGGGGDSKEANGSPRQESPPKVAGGDRKAFPPKSAKPAQAEGGRLPWKSMLLVAILVGLMGTVLVSQDVQDALDEGIQACLPRGVVEVLQRYLPSLSGPRQQEASPETRGAPGKMGNPEENPSADITSAEDMVIHEQLDQADQLVDNGQGEEALAAFEALLSRHPSSPRAHYGKARALDLIADHRRSNEYLERCIDTLSTLIQMPKVPPALLKMAGKHLAQRQQFRGWVGRASQTLGFLIQKLPEDLELQNDLGVTYLMSGRVEKARQVFQQVLEKKPGDGFASAHLGFIVQTTDANPEKAVPLLQAGIESGEPGTKDGRFYFQLGDALNRLGRSQEARVVYQKGAALGLFLSADQRSLYNVDQLTARPWWDAKQTGYQEALKLLEWNWETIRDEGLAQMNVATGAFEPEAENLREKGDWKQFTLYARGKKDENNCRKAPKTCALLDQIPEASKCRRGQVKYSVMQPGVHVWPHCGPTNCRIRAHLGLVVPEGPRIRVGNETRTWKEGKFIIFDDSFEHEVWHDGDKFRLVLIVDFWHPDLSQDMRRRLSPI